MFIIVLCYPFNVHGISSSYPSFISDINNSCLFLSLLVWLEVYQLYWPLTKTSICFHWFSLYKFTVFNFIDFYFYYMFSSAYFGFDFLFCFNYLRWKLKLMILDLSFFCNIFIHCISLEALLLLYPTNFWKVVFSFSYEAKYKLTIWSRCHTPS